MRKMFTEEADEVPEAPDLVEEFGSDLGDVECRARGREA